MQGEVPIDDVALIYLDSTVANINQVQASIAKVKERQPGENW